MLSRCREFGVSPLKSALEEKPNLRWRSKTVMIGGLQRFGGGKPTSIISRRKSVSVTTVPSTRYDRRSVPPARPGSTGARQRKHSYRSCRTSLPAMIAVCCITPHVGSDARLILLIDAASVGPFPLVAVAEGIDIGPCFVRTWLNRLETDLERVPPVVQQHGSLSASGKIQLCG